MNKYIPPKEIELDLKDLLVHQTKYDVYTSDECQIMTIEMVIGFMKKYKNFNVTCVLKDNEMMIELFIKDTLTLDIVLDIIKNFSSTTELKVTKNFCRVWFG